MARDPIPRLWVAEKVSHDYVADYKPFSFVDGEGVRCSLYVSGCLFKCEGCFNEDAWSFRCGKPYSDELESQILEDLAHESVQGARVARCSPDARAGHVVGHEPVHDTLQVRAHQRASLRQQQGETGTDRERCPVERPVGQLARQPEPGRQRLEDDPLERAERGRASGLSHHPPPSHAGPAPRSPPASAATWA